MPRNKVPRGELIASRRARAAKLAKGREGLKKKAKELSILCGARVAVVCADGDGAAPPDVWESEEGVLAAYRALPPAARAAHTHRAHADADLGKDEAKLARVRQGGPPALQRWDEALDGADAEEARRLLGDVDAALAAVEERRRALGLPDGVRYEQALWGHASQPGSYGVHQYPGGGGGADMDGYQLQMAAGMNGYSDANDTRLPWEAFQPSTHPGYASQWCGGMSGYRAQPVPSNGGLLQPNLHNAVGYPSLDIGLGYIDAPAAHNAQGYGGGNFINNVPPALSHAMGTGDNFMSPAPAQPLAMYTSGYTTQWPAQQQQLQSASSSQQSDIEQQLHYFSDVEDTQLQLWGN